MTNDSDDKALETLFQTARDSAPLPDADFMARLMQDADAHVPVPAPVVPMPASGGIWRFFEGWGGVTALASTAAAGVWIGVALPATIDLPGAELVGIGTDVSALLPGYGTDFLLEE